MATNRLKFLLRPLSILFGLVVMIRNYLFDHNMLRSVEFPVSLISVGNITVGGTGKTPHIEYLARLLQDRFRIAILSRGYMRSTTGFILASDHSASTEIGDEPLQMKLKFPGIVVAVDESRRNGIEKIMEQFPETEVILLDDAFQHRWVTPGLSLLLTDYSRLFTRDYLLPFGRLREQRYNSRRADIIIVSKAPSNLSPIDRRLIEGEITPLEHQLLYLTSIEYGELRNIHSDDASGISLSDITEMGSHVLLLTGIANPEPMRRYIDGYSASTTLMSFSDHHVYTLKELSEIKRVYSSLPSENRCIITTEKDSFRLREAGDLRNIFDDNFYYLPITVTFNNTEQEKFNNHIIKYVEKDRANRFISKVKRDK